MKLFLIDEVPENPCAECQDNEEILPMHCFPPCTERIIWEKLQSILSKAIPIEEIDKLVLGWLDTTPMPCFGYDGDNLWRVEGIPLSQYLQQQIVK